MFLMTDFINLKIKSTKSFKKILIGCVHLFYFVRWSSYVGRHDLCWAIVDTEAISARLTQRRPAISFPLLLAVQVEVGDKRQTGRDRADLRTSHPSTPTRSRRTLFLE
jgi:hypothetical protein